MATHPRGIPIPTSLITTHNEDEKSIFLAPPEKSHPTYKLLAGSDTVYADIHCAPSVPAILSSTSSHYDLAGTQDMIDSNRSITGLPRQSPGIVLRRTDMAPNTTSPLHRTLTLDYGILVRGELELTLDSGEKRIMKVGDTIVQRGTMHQWRNPSETEFASMVWVMAPIDPRLDRTVLVEQWGERRTESDRVYPIET
jgi:quercetin dioxygenase-like cupin family protein